MKLGSLCTGYGGLDMAVERYFDAETVWFRNKPIMRCNYFLEHSYAQPVDNLQTRPILRVSYPHD